jgi:hypothetical protein
MVKVNKFCLNVAVRDECSWEYITKVNQLPIDSARYFQTGKVICGGENREGSGIEYATLKL